MGWITAVLIAVSGLLLPPAQAQGRKQPTPPASKPTIYNPDLNSCQPDNLRAGFQRQLQPYADQGEAVLQRLRQVQAELTRASLERCVAKGLMDGPTAQALAAELLGAAAMPQQASDAPTRP